MENKPDHFDSLHLLGIIFHQRGLNAAAVQLLDLALQISPTNVSALYNRGITLTELKRFDEAILSYDRALAEQPGYAEAWSNRGIVLYKLKRFDEALASYDRAIIIRPDYAEALSNRGLVLHDLMRFDEALLSYSRALAVQPRFAQALLNRGITLNELKRFDEALENYNSALVIRPDYAEVLSNRGITLHELKRLGEALASLERAIALRSNFEQALYNRGNVLSDLGRLDDALASYNRALAVQPENVEALLNRGNVLRELGRFEEALTSYNRATAVRSDCANAHFNAGLLHLLIGDFSVGWEKNEWRWETEQARHEKRRFSEPLWTGSNELAGKTILLHAEQGFGDSIQFCRYVPLVATRAARVILEVQRSLCSLMRSLPGEARIVPRGEPLPDFDTHCPLLSLPRAFGSCLGTIPGDVPYLRASADAVTSWTERLGPRPHPRIGLAWSGSPTHSNNRNRSIRLDALLPLLKLDATFVSLQRDVGASDAAVLHDRSDFLHFGDELKEFADTAALMSNLDLIITVDTSIAHLAGALGKPVWILLPFVPDWRWLLGRNDSPWYPTARLFRQDETRRWDHIIALVYVALAELVNRR